MKTLLLLTFLLIPNSCEVSGKVYNDKFNGKKFVVQK
jgi:hypothetical protein